MTARRSLSTALLTLAPLVVALAAVGWHADVPDPLPTHWGLRGHVDGTTAFAPFTAVVLVVTVLAALAGAVLVWRDRAVAFVGVLFGGLAWLFAALYAGTLAAAAGADRAVEVDLPWWLLVVALVVPLVVGGALYLLLPPATAVVSSTLPVLDLAPGERVAWFGSARSSGLAWLGGVLAVIGAVLVVLEPVLGISLLVIGVVVWWLHVVTVRVDEHGLRATWGPTRWPHRTVRLDHVAGAEVIDLDPLQWGGWGYRVSPRGTAFVVRRGPAVVVHRRHGSDLAVTVDHPEDAAALLNALVQRSAV